MGNEFWTSSRFQLEMYPSQSFDTLLARSAEFRLGALHNENQPVLIANNNLQLNLPPDQTKQFNIQCSAITKQLQRPVISMMKETGMRILPLYGLDMSLGNLTFDDNICLHRAKVGTPNLYRDAVRDIHTAIQYLTSSGIISYGCSAKMKTGDGPTLDQFPISYSTPMFEDYDTWQDSYNSLIKSIEFALPAN